LFLMINYIAIIVVYFFFWKKKKLKNYQDRLKLK